MLYYGCDTETYNETINGKQNLGLKSIQLFGYEDEQYFLDEDYLSDDLNIRFNICSQFFDYLFKLEDNSTIGFFNLTFDFSQFVYYLVTESGLKIEYEKRRLKKGYMSFLETDRKMYAVFIQSPITNKKITFIDIANFCGPTTLDKLGEDWVHEKKEKIDSKIFPKRKPTEEEKKYAMKDAELTYKIMQEYLKLDMLKPRTYTIAGLTIKNFMEFLKEYYGVSFNQYFYKTEDEELINQMKEKIESIRYINKGGICMAWQKGVFENCTHIDAKSMYPTQMVRDFIPVGPLLDEEPNCLHTKIIFPSGIFIKKKDKIPCVQWTKKADCMRYKYQTLYDAGDYVWDFFLDGSFGFWKEEYEVILRHYNVYQLEIEKEYYIELKENIAVKNYVNMLYKGKRENTGTIRLYYKYLLNSLYGKFLTRPDGISINYIEDIDGWHREKMVTEKNTYYFLFGSWIAMYGRVTLLNAIDSIDVNDFLYCDTDSIIYKGNKNPNVTIGKELGMWGYEHKNVIVNVVGPKTYQELTSDEEHGELITKCGGLPSKVKDLIEWGQLKDGMTVKCQKPKRNKTTWNIDILDTVYTISTRASMFRRN